MQDKHIENWLVIDWKSGATRTRKSEPTDLGTYEIATRLSIDVEVPDVEVPDLAARVEVPQPHVQTAVLESVDEEDLPDHADVAAEIVDDHRDELERNSELPDHHDRLVDELTTKTLIAYDGYADPEDVRATVTQLAKQVEA